MILVMINNSDIRQDQGYKHYSFVERNFKVKHKTCDLKLSDLKKIIIVMIIVMISVI